MTEISNTTRPSPPGAPLGANACQSNPSSPGYSSKSSLQEKSASCGASCLSILTAPLRFIGRVFTGAFRFVQTYILCCCTYPEQKERLNWAQAKEAFSKICSAIANPEAANFQKLFNQGFNELSAPARGKFEEHVGLVLAQRNGGHECQGNLSAQEKWWSENKDRYAMKDVYFQNALDHLEILRPAVDSFKKEIDSNLK